MGVVVLKRQKLSIFKQLTLIIVPQNHMCSKIVLNFKRNLQLIKRNSNNLRE